MTERWLHVLNEGSADDQVAADLMACCSSRQWADRMLDQRPYADSNALLVASDAAIAALDDVGLADALAGHPRIGERPTGSAHEWSRREQSGVSTATAGVLEEIAAANAEYERRFGRVYLVCATGKTADELLAICRSRLGNDPQTEEGVVRIELAKITRIRLGRLLGSYDAA
ncbi:MAG TPA: 2-oxo-4-hydroxy-4-carboxy-5-ureidoimidazoline decarboxylase [Mycobacteriales bacterium]|nr:2-oxo-4-hydroxy-4-carboxy-5-ureidoimidazoline decarboxylase [Mycobacteriales bacterium]